MVELLPARKPAGTPPPRGWAAWGWGKGEGLLGPVLGPLSCFRPDCGHLSFAYFLSTLKGKEHEATYSVYAGGDFGDLQPSDSLWD